MARDPYKALGIKPDATAAEIKKAYRKKATKAHPDAGGDGEEFRDIATAYEILGDPEKRKAWDENAVEVPSGIVESNLANLLQQLVDVAITGDGSVDMSQMLTRAKEQLNTRLVECINELDRCTDAIRKLEAQAHRVMVWKIDKDDELALNAQTVALNVIEAKLKQIKAHEQQSEARKQVQADTLDVVNRLLKQNKEPQAMRRGAFATGYSTSGFRFA